MPENMPENIHDFEINIHPRPTPTPTPSESEFRIPRREINDDLFLNSIYDERSWHNEPREFNRREMPRHNYLIMPSFSERDPYRYREEMSRIEPTELDRETFRNSMRNLFESYPDFSATLGERRNFTQAVFKRLEAVKPESIKKILELSKQSGNEPSTSEAVNLLLGESKKEAAKLASDFYTILSQKEDQEPVRIEENEQYFVDAVKTEMASIPDDVDPRIIRSEFSALHSLVFSGGLDLLYRKYQEECVRTGKEFPQNEADIVNIKSELAYKFIEQVRAKNSEEAASEIPSGMITVGMEIEYNNFIKQEMRTKGIYEALVAEFDTYIANAKTRVEREVYEKVRSKVAGRLQILNSITEGRDPDKVASSFDSWEPGVQGAVEMQIIKKSISSVKEIKTRPTATYKTQLRELVSAASIGGLRDAWGIHETFGGITLTEEHTEFMDALPMAIAAGFIDFDKVNENLKRNSDLGYGIVSEKYKKSSVGGDTSSILDSKVAYFPFHKLRSHGVLENLANQDKSAMAVEVRSLPEYKQGSFPKLVRQISFQYFFAHSVKSLQKEESARIGQDNDLITAHTELMAGWKDLLATKGIEMPTPEEKYIEGDKSEDLVDRNKYIVFIGRMVVLSQDDKDFSQKTRELIREYNLKVKNALAPVSQ